MADVWERRADDGETVKAFSAFQDYLSLGEGRSVGKLLAYYRGQNAGEVGMPTEPPTKRKNTLTDWSSRFDWVTRAEAWDLNQLAAQAEFMADRRNQLIEREWADYERQMEEYALAIDRAKMHRQRRANRIKGDDGKDVEVITVELTFNDWIALARWRKDISDIGRKAVGLPPDNRSLRIGNLGDEAFKVSPEGLVDQMAAALRELEDYHDSVLGDDSDG